MMRSDLRRTRGSVHVLRGTVLVLASFAALSGLISIVDGTRAQDASADDEPDFPDLFRQVDRRLQESYLDLDRVRPRELVERALSSLELSADEIYVERLEDDKPYVALHVGEMVTMVDLQRIQTRLDSVLELESVFKFVARHYRGERSLNELRYAAANGYLSGIDPHTLVFNPESAEEFEIHIAGEIFGVGMMVGASDTGKLEVKQVLKDTPAQRAGFRRGDIITKIADESAINMTVQEAVNRIRGPKDSEIVLTVKRETKKDESLVVESLEIPVRRDRVVIKSVESALIREPAIGSNPAAAEPPAGGERGIGYVLVTNFDRNTTPALAMNLIKLRAEFGRPLDGLILDLRGNTGGLLDQAEAMCDLFLESGDIVVTAKKDDKLSHTRAKDDGDEPAYPMVLLADENSASGAEIVLGALQKNDRAIVLGTRSFGKGSVQQLQRLPHGAQLKITVSEYLIPGNISIQENGVVPDVLARGVVLDAEGTNLFPEDRSIGERDYDSHIVSKYAREEEPLFTLRYLLSTELDEDAPTPQERFLAGELTPGDDPLVRMAMELLPIARAKESDQSMRVALAKETQAIEQMNERLEREIVGRLAELGTDWTPRPEDVAAPKLSATLSHELVSEPSLDADDPVPVPKVVLKTRVTNVGDVPAYRIKGLTHSDHSFYDHVEFLFGKIAPGETVERTSKLVLPYFTRAQLDRVELVISDPTGPLGTDAAAEVALPYRPRPVFGYAATLVDGEGQVIDRLGTGENFELRVGIENRGQGPAHEGIAILRNKTGRRVFLKKGRVELEEVGPGQKKDVSFEFDIRDGEAVEQYEFELVIYDSYSRETLSRTLAIPLRESTRDGFASGTFFEPPAIELTLGSPADAAAPPVGLTTTDESVLVEAKVSSGAGEVTAFVTQLPLSRKNGNPDKVFFATGQGRDELTLSTRVYLDPGVNLVTVVAKDHSGIEQTRSIVVRRDVPEATASATSAGR